ncbi:MAG TPA: hypothetical protein VIM34_12580 [Burkholderiaceae bacterium]
MTRVHAHTAHAVAVAAGSKRTRHTAAGKPAANVPQAKLVHGLVAQAKGAHAKVLAEAIGMLIVPDADGGRTITQAEFDVAAGAIMALPEDDVARVASAGVALHLEPAASLGQGLLGATKIIQGADGRWQPQVIHVAAQANLAGTESLTEIVQHEFGHAISVLTQQDRSEAAAIAYAASH